MRLVVHVHYRPFPVTSEESLRDSEPWIIEHQGTGDFMRSECVKLVHLHTLSAFLAEYMCFVKL